MCHTCARELCVRQQLVKCARSQSNISIVVSDKSVQNCLSMTNSLFNIEAPSFSKEPCCYHFDRFGDEKGWTKLFISYVCMISKQVEIENW